jgi:hypothetical protein
LAPAAKTDTFPIIAFVEKLGASSRRIASLYLGRWEGNQLHNGRLPPIAEGVHQLQIEKREGGTGTRLWVEDLPGLLGLVKMGAVELRTLEFSNR